MSQSIILASSSEIRQTLLKNAGISVEALPARVDEPAIKSAMIAEGARVRDIADALAEQKARKISAKRPGALVLGCDQALSFDGGLISKPANKDEMKDQLRTLSSQKHELLSAAVIYENFSPVWRHIGVVKMTMRKLSEDYIDDYADRNWDSVHYCVGGYKLEEEGSRLFSRIDGDYFHVLGLPLLEVMTFLIDRGDLEI
ncbi:nucleoside triphosphate pyrophosphatase [Roseovarius sp. EL26]|uniref:Maf family protein n=1 Tax=Roseovarius sp. EL26 TaxID=2126672 RepID=UPI000EA26847|nr:Maf family protein [Roseovarius sp. EL26]